MVIRRIVLYAAATMIGLVLTSPFILEPVIKTRMAAFIEKKTGAVVEPNQMIFELSPYPVIRFNSIDLPLNQVMGLHINGLQANLDMSELLRGNLVISSMILEDVIPRFSPEMNQETLNLQNLPEHGFQGDRIKLLFDLLPDSQEELTIELKHSRFPFFSSGSGTLWISKPRQILQIDALIKDVKVQKNPFFQSLHNGTFPLDQFESDAVHLHARFDVESGITGTVKVNHFQILSGRLPDKAISGNGLNLKFLSSPDLVSLDLTPTDLYFPAAQVSISFTDDRISQKTTLVFSGNNIDMSQARDVSLAIAPENKVVRHLFDILRSGTASEVSVRFQSESPDALFNARQMTLEGTARNAVVKIPRTLLMAKDVDGTARVVNGVLEINAGDGRAAGTKINAGRLDIDLMNHRKVPFNGEFVLDVDLSKVPDLLISLLPGTALAKEMAKVSQVEGQVTATLVLGMQTGQPKLSVSVTTGPFSGSGYYDRIPFPLTISQGIFHYGTNQIQLKNVSGHIGTNTFKDLTAQVDLSRDNFMILSTRALDLDIQAVWPEIAPLKAVRTFMGPVNQAEGRLVFEQLHVRGPMFHPVRWIWDLSGSAEDVQLGFSAGIREIQDLSGFFELSEDGFTARDLTAMITNLNWLPFQMTSSLFAGIVMPLSTKDGEIDLDRNRISVSTHMVFESNTRLSIQLSGDTLANLKPDIIMLQHEPLTDAMAIFSREDSLTRVRFEGKLDTRTLDAVLIETAMLHHVFASITGDTPLKIYTDNQSNLHLETRFVNLDQMISSFTEERTPEGWPQLSHRHCYLKTDQLVYGNYSFSDLRVVITRDPHQTDIQLLRAGLFGLGISGHLMIDRTQPETLATTNISIQATDQENISPLLSCIFPDLHLMEGSYSLSVNLEGNGRPASLKHHLNGDLTFESHNGQIHKMTLLSRLLSVLNILKLPDITQEGFRYHSILVDGQIEDGVIHLKKAVINAEDMALTFIGKIYPFENKLDLTCLVAPLKTIDTIIQFIPIVNTILSNRLVSFPAKATGAINDPVITPLHPSAVGEGLKNILINIAKFPVRLLKGRP